MRINKLEKMNKVKMKPINKEGLLYSLTFVIYLIVLIFIFISATKYLSKTINTALSTPVSEDITARYGQIDLANYGIVADKLGLKKPTEAAAIANPVITANVTATSSEIASSTPSTEISTTTPDTVSTSTPAVTDLFASSTVIAPIATSSVEIKPTIAIINSTTKSGLAGNLKNELTSAGFNVANTSTVKANNPKTIINVKASISQDSTYLSQIKKIVGTNYDFVLGVLDANSNQDVEVIIGNK